MDDDPQQQPNPLVKFPSRGINTNTYVSLSLFAMGLAGFWTILNAIYAAKTDIGSRMDKMDFRIQNIENHKQVSETWTDRDMFKWAVHLQRDNPAIKVPEPEMHTHPDQP